MSESPFRQRAVFWIVLSSAVSLAAGLMFVVFGGEVAEPDSYRANAYSRSAVGHHAFVELLRRFDIPVLISRYESSARAGDSAVLVLAEPNVWRLAEDPYETLGDPVDFRLGPTLLILPKRTALRSLEEPLWVDDTGLIDIPHVERVLDLIAEYQTIVRLPATDTTSDWALHDSRLAGQPSLRGAQLFEPSDTLGWRPLVSNSHGVLVAETRSMYDAPIVVVSDPDIFATHGLEDGENALLALSIVDYLRDGSSAVVIDETSHGHQSRPTIWRQLFKFPLVLAIAHGAVLLGFVLWLAMRRFGPAERPPPPIAPGKTFLVDNTAELLRFGGHSGHALRRYWFNVLQDVGQTVNAPPQLDTRELRNYLAELAGRRGIRPPVQRIAAEVNALSAEVGERHARAVVRTARRIHEWRGEMIDGSGSHPSA